MTPFDVDSESVQHALRRLSNADASDIKRLRHLLRQITPEMMVRVGLLELLPVTVDALAPQAPDWVSAMLSQQSSSSIFSTISVGWAVLSIASAGHVVWPHKPLQDAGREIIARSSKRIIEHPLMKPIMLACQDDFRTYLKVSTGTGTWFWMHGNEYHRDLGPNRAMVEHEERLPGVVEWIVPGLIDGLFGLFNVSGEVSVETTAPTAGAVHIEWQTLS